MKWNDLTRAEKIAHLFDYPYEERVEKVTELWGKNASEYAESVYFPYGTPWHEIVTVLKKTGKTQFVYAKIDINDVYGVSLEHMQRNEDAAIAMLGWRKKLITSDTEDRLYVEFYDESTLLCNVCTDEGERYGPSYWANALMNLSGKVIRPFEPGNLHAPQKNKAHNALKTKHQESSFG